MFDESTHLTSMLALDVYALGIIMWQLWFKQTPFKGKNAHSIIILVMRGKRPAFKGEPNQGPAPPEPLMALIEACWAQEYKDRPSVAQVFGVFDSTVESAVETFEGRIGPVEGRNLSEKIATLTQSMLTLTRGTGMSLSGRVSTSNRTLVSFLAEAELDQFAPVLAEQGFSDVDAVCDKEVLDDDTLAHIIGMSKTQIRRLREIIAGRGSTVSRLTAGSLVTRVQPRNSLQEPEGRKSDTAIASVGRKPDTAVVTDSPETTSSQVLPPAQMEEPTPWSAVDPMKTLNLPSLGILGDSKYSSAGNKPGSGLGSALQRWPSFLQQGGEGSLGTAI